MEKQSLPVELRTGLSWCLVFAVLSLLSNLLPVSDLPGKAKSLIFLPVIIVVLWLRRGEPEVIVSFQNDLM